MAPTTPTAAPVKRIPPAQLVEIDRIEIDPDRFSPRVQKLDRDHVKKLATLIKDGRRRLDPVAIWQRAPGAPLHLVDGHHRVEAHRQAKRREVYARVWTGPVTEAFRLMAHDNAKLRLPLTYGEKADFAWQLVRKAMAAGQRVEAGKAAGDDADVALMSKAHIAGMSCISERTVATMRKAAREKLDAGEDVEKLPASWQTVLQSEWHRPTLAEVEQREDAIRETLVGQLMPILGPHLGKRPITVAQAVEEVLGRRADEIFNWLTDGRYKPEEGDPARDF